MSSTSRFSRMLCWANLFVLVYWLLACDETAGGVSVQVVDVFGRPVIGAQLRVKGQARISDNGGWVMLERAPVGQYTIEITKSGYLPGYRTLELRKGEAVSSRVVLQPFQSRTFRTDRKEIINADGLEIEIPANAFVSGKGQATVRFASLDVAGEGLKAMPGEFDGTEKSGQQTQIESHGAWNITVVDGERELQPSRPLIVRVPVIGTFEKDLRGLPLWSFDTGTGKWVEQGEVRLARRGKTLWARADLTHLSWWNIDQPIRTKAAIWVQSFEDGSGRKLFTPGLSGRGKDLQWHQHALRCLREDSKECARPVPGCEG